MKIDLVLITKIAFVCINNTNEFIVSPTPIPPTPPLDFLDLAVANTDSDDASILLGNGDGTFGPADDLGAGDFPGFVAVGKF
jgi:hypothetical protein